MLSHSSVFNSLRAQAIAPLPIKEEWDLHRKWRQGCKRSGDRLVRAHIPTVLKWTLHYVPAWDSKDDLASAGLQGIAMAMDKFDPDRGVSFFTYASYWVRHHVVDQATRMRHMVGGGPKAAGSRYLKLRREAARVAHIQDHGERIAELARFLGTGEVQAQRCSDFLRSSMVWMDGATSDERSVHETIASPQDENTTDAAVSARLLDAIEKLTPQERDVVYRRVMNEETFDHIAKELGVTRQRAHQVGLRAFEKLRSLMRADDEELLNTIPWYAKRKRDAVRATLSEAGEG